MNDETDPRILELAGYGDDLLRATILLAEVFYGAKDAHNLKELSKFAGRKAKLLGQIPTVFETEWARELDNFEMLTLYELMRLKPHDRAIVAKDWRDKTMSWGDVRALVDAQLKRKPREPKANPTEARIKFLQDYKAEIDIHSKEAYLYWHHTERMWILEMKRSTFINHRREFVNWTDAIDALMGEYK